MEQLHIEKEKMFNLMESIGFSDSLIKKNRIIIDRYIDYLNDHSYQLSLESANLFSENYYTLFPTSRKSEYCVKKISAGSLQIFKVCRNRRNKLKMDSKANRIKWSSFKTI